MIDSKIVINLKRKNFAVIKKTSQRGKNKKTMTKIPGSPQMILQTNLLNSLMN